MTSPIPSERWHAVQEVVDGALDRPAAERIAFLRTACGDDAELLSAAARLLRACERADRPDGLLSGSALTLAGPLVRAAAEEEVARAEQRSAATLHALRSALAGRYDVEREIARGGMAVVYLARDLRHDRAVAIKVLDISVAAASAARFLREIRTTARLTHPHVLAIHDSGEADGFLYYVMPFVAGGETLRARIRREGPLPMGEAVRLMREIADAVAYAHAEGLVHRDLKPENVLLSGGHAVVADFGIARALAAASGVEPSSIATDVSTGGPVSPAATSALGTPAYMAPEQAAGAGDHRTDLYALGIVAYEMLAGAHPAGAGLRERAEVLAPGQPVPLHEIRADVPGWLAALVQRLLEREPDARPADAAAVIRTIDEGAGRPVRGHSRLAAPRARITAAALVLLAGLGAYQGIRAVRPQAGAAPETSLHVAVLPFGGSEDGSAYFSQGISDELAHTLGRLPGVRVSGDASSRTLRGSDARAIGRAMRVDAIVTGTASRANGRLLVHAAVVRTSDGVPVWENSYAAPAADLFSVQNRLAGDVAAALLPEPPTTVRTGATAGRGTMDAEAWDVFVKGRHHFLERGADNVAQSIAHFRQAIALDPMFARAHAALAIAYGVLPSYVAGAADSTMSLIAASASRAVALDSTLADAHIALAIADENALQFGSAVERYRRAIALEPSNVMAYHALGMLLRTMGRTEEAIDVLHRAERLDPLAKSVATALSGALTSARRFEDAAAAARRALAVDSTFPLGLLSLGAAQAFDGHADSAVATLERAVALHPQQSISQSHLLFAYAAAGRWDDAVRLRDAILRDDRSGGADGAFAHLVFGDPQPLVALLLSPAGQRSWLNTTVGFGCYPLLDPLWSDDRVREGLRAIGVLPCDIAAPWPFRVPDHLRAG